MEIEETSVFQRSWRVSHDLPEENKVAFFDEAQSELVVVNALGGVIWQMLDGARSVKDICDVLFSEVNEPPPREQLEREVRKFLAELLERNAISFVDE